MVREGNTILTLDNGYHLWTRTDNAGGDIKLLCLHGGLVVTMSIMKILLKN